ncbi:class I SAM-dependent methyltransferase [Gramella sp. BOM4]|nr:class I SAM-dependent methyltransferase [Christiangramia bathymodioli]
MKEQSNAREIFDKYAGAYQEKYMDVDRYSSFLDIFIKNLDRNDTRILEIGCGPGNLTKYLLKKLPQLKITGIDFSENMINLARENNPQADFLVMDARDIGNLNAQFGAVVCGFCLPYFSPDEVSRFITNISNMLEAPGLVFFSFMESESGKQFEVLANKKGENLETWYHKASEISKILTNHGFEILTTARIENPANANSVFDRLVLARKDQGACN